eukprot:11206543-Lingulodinium_polyedra.AAC.1
MSLCAYIRAGSDSDPNRMSIRSDSDQSKIWDTSEIDADLTLIWLWSVSDTNQPKRAGRRRGKMADFELGLVWARRT